MPLADYAPPTRSVGLGGGMSMTVRGLSLYDVGRLVSLHRDAIEVVFIRFVIEQQRVELAGEGWTDRDVVTVITDMLSEAPIIAATLIAYAADEPDEFEKAMQLPMPYQIEALKVIGELTCVDEATAKKMWADTKQMIANLIPSSMTISASAGNGMDTSSNSTGDFDETHLNS